MSCKVSTSKYFDKEAKRLSKKYHSFKTDLQAFAKELAANPLQGTEIAPNIRKIRMAIKSKGKGKSGGARIIIYNILTTSCDGEVLLLLIYDKEESSSVSTKVLQQYLKELGLL